MRKCVFWLAVALASATSVARQPATPVHTVHLVYSHHLDVGLDLPLKDTKNCVGFATKIVQRYFDEFIPRAISLAKHTYSFGRSFKYQIHPWIASMYTDCVPWTTTDGCAFNPGNLICPSAKAVAAFDAAVVRGDIVYAASPFNINPEVVGEPTMFEDMVGIAGALDQRYNLTKAEKVWSNVDVKGFARSAIPLLKRAGVNTLYIGTNGGPSTNQRGKGLQPVVGNANATMFTWVDPPSGEEMTVLYTVGYGSFINGHVSADTALVSPSGVALVSHWASDNAGPPLTPVQVEATFATVQRLWPTASVKVSSFGAFAEEGLTPAAVAALPRSSLDWGDQWITGQPSPAAYPHPTPL